MSASTPPQGLNYMLLGRERLCYSGLLGNSRRSRSLGCLTIYVAPAGGFDLSVAGGPWQRQELAVLAPFTEHRISSDCGRMYTLGLETEAVAPEALLALQTSLMSASARAQTAARLRAVAHGLAPEAAFCSREFDERFFTQPLPARALDARIAQVLAELHPERDDADVSAQSCAQRVGLSTSRFLHVFKGSVGISFRAFRMWKRARRFLDHAAGGNSLTDVALDLGYPDASHFSHTIRRTFGLQPRSIRAGSRDLRVQPGRDYTLAATAF